MPSKVKLNKAKKSAGKSSPKVNQALKVSLKKRRKNDKAVKNASAALDGVDVENKVSPDKLVINSAEYKCHICDDRFNTPVILSGHIRNVHEVFRHKPVSRICKMKFAKFVLNMGIKLSCAKKLF